MEILLEALERAVQEVEALQSIYQHDEQSGSDDPSRGSSQNCFLLVKSIEALERSKAIVEEQNHEIPLSSDDVPLLELELHISAQVVVDTKHNSCRSARIYFGLPPGYPSSEPVNVTILTAQGMARTTREELAARLQTRANKLVGSEAIMELIQECQDQLLLYNSYESVKTTEEQEEGEEDGDTNPIVVAERSDLFGRRWIWVHHIKDRQRREDIVREARALTLGGYLKAGYPGIVVIEGTIPACDEFVSWIKGNKSRPGGFGRQWGHHVRGEVLVSERRLLATFEELEKDMSALASHCRNYNLESEFLKFVMQHG
jgi:hypothetical protein